jgi:hypothetical protein
MTDYKNIFGKPVKFLATDPDNAEAEGQIWYNSTSGTFKSVVVGEAWSSGAPLITARQALGGAGTQTAGLAFGGSIPTNQTTEEYNGSGWATGGNLTTGRQDLSGAGTQTAGLAFGGNPGASPYNTNATEEYNGSTWGPGGNLGTARYGMGAAGTQTAALGFAGVTYPTPVAQTATEEYDGSTWTAGGSINTGRRFLAGAGTQTAGLAFGGSTPSPTATAATEEYNGTSWTTVNSMNTARTQLAGCGTQTAGLAFGGASTLPPATPLSNTEKYDGISWTTTTALATARRLLAGAGVQPSTLAFGGTTGSATAVTEEYNKSINVITPAAWSAGGNLPTAKTGMADGGTQTAAIEGAGLQNDPDAAQTSSSEYNGTSWTAANPLSGYYSVTAATGTQTALITGGAANGSTNTFEYDGTNWTSGGALGTGRYQGKNLGTQTAAVYCGGRVSPPTLNNVEEYDGSTWTSATGMPIAIRSSGGYGIQTAGTIVSGFQGPATPPVSPAATVTRSLPGFDYDGTSWTTGTSALIAGASGGAAGTQTNAIYLAGENPALSPGEITTSQKYDGTAYTTDAAVGRSRATGFGITSSRTAEVGSAAMIFGGNAPGDTPADTNATEEYNVATTAINFKTLTTS